MNSFIYRVRMLFFLTSGSIFGNTDKLCNRLEVTKSRCSFSNLSLAYELNL
jgi:hypothetical protein